MRIFWILGLPIGAIFIMYTEWFITNFGLIDWAEEKFGSSGGTRTFYKLFGLGIIIISLLGVSGALGGIVLGLFGGLFRGFSN
ncbi:MAG: hypothetical protein UT86_C0002G0097 [Candidatus Magasanikbacteria bacterium GW2011_GWC2_40_17]|uniref:Uncharacterized protein n=1 Tax=Candidatus Magasanikbacteria bacterium GW2011_GWA2_42_32 TaxID=1619039 RepID=A0A0G1D5E9_9BACT|nr:MAG: hypothetical protein UT86_C0002G0097 [Candidatus Magasanikbacteria bacterium GW2011_GWC2_40_17]KKS57258.1 MAG: hypothetical protein UV20_C0002G0047 [Candidatus Magasanikbacteria bacterium GW2011_GWA2_42_32]